MTSSWMFILRPFNSGSFYISRPHLHMCIFVAYSIRDFVGHGNWQLCVFLKPLSKLNLTFVNWGDIYLRAISMEMVNYQSVLENFRLRSKSKTDIIIELFQIVFAIWWHDAMGAFIIIIFLQEPLLLIWINFNPTMNKNNNHHKVWDEITYPFPNFNGATVEVWEWISHPIPHVNISVIIYPCSKLNHVSKRGPW